MALEILLSVYGRAAFIGEFLQSLKNQDFQDFRLLYRFDGDAAPEVEALLKNFPGSVELPGREHLGVVRSYQTLLNCSTADHLMLADQDDIWHPDKVSCSVAALEKLERGHEKNIPLLVHTDLRVIDCSGRLIKPSLWQFQALNPRKNRLQDLMIQNNVTGCTMILNRALADLASFPEGAICHDWYLAMTAAALGKIMWLNHAFIDYRQHPDNVYGAVSRSKFFENLKNRQLLHECIELTQKQAQAFLSQFREKLTPEQIKNLDIWGNALPRMGYWKRLFSVCRYQFRKNDWLRTLGMYWAL